MWISYLRTILFGTVLLWAHTAQGVPIVSLTSGQVVFQGEGGVTWSLAGPDFVATGGGEGNAKRCFPCPTGPLSLSAGAGPASPFSGAGTVTYQGVTYTAGGLGPIALDIGGPSLLFSGSTIIPAVDVPSMDVSGSFAMTGRFFLFPTPFTPFELDLVGQGTVIHHLLRDTSLPPAAGILYDDVGFSQGPLVYQLTAAVPEPATWLLLIMGMAALLLGRNRHRIIKSPYLPQA